jgi:iron complex outermembrane recepter protein
VLNNVNSTAFKSALMAGAAMATVAGMSPAYAQDQQVEKVVVTGSRIPQKGLTSTSPVSTITSAESKLQGTTSVETLLNNMPQVIGNQGSEVSNGSSGTSTLDLRGLGPQRTLVLVNGKRLQPANVLQPTPDLNTIPIAMVERVEVLTGGASAVYGADAVAGVVNFIMRKNFEGMEVGAQYQFNNHENDNTRMRNLIAAGGYKNADKEVNDGRVISMWGIMGANIAEGQGNVTAYLQYRHVEAILQDQRDFSACSLSGFLNTHVCQGSSNGATGRFTSVDDASPVRFTANSAVPGTMRPFSNATDTYNFAPLNYLQRPDERFLLGATTTYELSDNLEFYADTSFMDDRTVAQIAPSGFFANSGPQNGNYLVNCSNPFLQTGAPEVGSTQVTPFNALCGNQLSAPLGVGGTATVNIGRRFVETPLGRQDDFETTSFRLLAGLRGQLEDWDYDVYGQFGTTSTPRSYLNDASSQRTQRALLVVLDPRPTSPTFNQPVCQSVLDGTDLSCVPANIFSFGTLSQAAIAYMTSTGLQKTVTEEQIISGSLNGDFGFGSPWASDPVSAAFGAEYRFSALKHTSDDVFKTGDLLGQGGAAPDVDGHYDVSEAFGEIQVPLVQDQEFAKLIELNAGYRISDYDNAGITHTYGYGLAWMPSDDIRFRGSFQHAVRAPNVIELFAPAAQGLWVGSDPCSLTSGSSPAFYNAAQCANTGLSAAQYALFTASPAFQCPAAQCSGTFGGNPNLKPESSDTKSFGFVFTPTFIKGFSGTVDYYDIEITDTIRVINQMVALGNCAVTGNPFACSLIHRSAGTGSLSNSAVLGAGVDSKPRNSGVQTSTGVDVEANYKFALDDVGLGEGALALSFTGSYLESFETNFGAGFDTFDCKGMFGIICGNPAPEWKHRMRATWQTPWDLDLSFAWRHLGEADLDIFDGTDRTFRLNCNGSCGNRIDSHVKSFNYLDLAFSWNATDNIAFQGGINNVLDKDPPVFDSNVFGVSGAPFGNGNTFPVIYDSLGREVFISMTTKF